MKFKTLIGNNFLIFVYSQDYCECFHRLTKARWLVYMFNYLKQPPIPKPHGPGKYSPIGAFKRKNTQCFVSFPFSSHVPALQHQTVITIIEHI